MTENKSVILLEMPGIVNDTVISSEHNSPDPCGNSKGTAAMQENKDSSLESTSDTSSTLNLKPEEVIPAQKATEENGLSEADKPEVPMKLLDLKVSINGLSDLLSVQLSNHDTVQDIRQIILEKPECCYRTCFSLYLDKMRLDDFMELHDIPGLTDSSLIKVVDEPYSIREARIHIRRLRDLLVTMLEPNAFTATDNLSLSYCSAITEIDVEEEALKAVKDKNNYQKGDTALPPESAHLKSKPLIGPMIVPDYDVTLPTCLKDMRFSAWNPPPGYRKLAGDLLYLEIVTLDRPDHVYNVTSSSNGFFVNKITNNLFDPRPVSDTQRSQTLAGLLNIISPLFKKNFSSIQRTTIKKHPLELVSSPHQVFPWVSPQFEHNQDSFRAEDAVTNRIGYEEQIPGQLRDWNEELQSAKELPKKTRHQRTLRDRALYKITCDFIAAATRGAVAVVDGNVMAINPGEEEKMRMYIWNNIFFSFACDSRDHYEKYGGDEAAYTAASLDLKGVELYNKLDVEGLYTLGTVVVDYRGYRIIAQSIIPGILQREQENSVVYGSVDGGKTIVSHEQFLEKLKTAGLSLKIKPHKVINEKNEDIELCSSIECKGIIGADGRHYILDLFRTFPPDVNFLDVEKVPVTLINGESIPEKKNSKKDSKKDEFTFPVPHAQNLVSLRQAALEAFIGYKYVSFVKVIAVNKLQDENKKETEKKAIEKANGIQEGNSTEKENTTECVATESNDVKENADASTSNGTDSLSEEEKQKLREEEDESDLRAVEAAAEAIGSLNPREFDIRFNPDAYVPEVIPSKCESGTEQKEKKLMEDMSQFIYTTLIPKLIEDLSNLSTTPIDGIALTDIMHARGINMRYLGKIAHMCKRRRNLDYVYAIVIKEMILRAAKKQFKGCMQSTNQRCLGASTSHFLNCFLSSFPSPQPQLPSEEGGGKKKKNKKKSQKLPHLPSNTNVLWIALSPAALWSSMAEHVQKHFGFKIESTNIDAFIETYRVQKVSMLREFCKKTGIQMALREYDMDGKKNATFSDEHILNIFPVVKCVTPRATDATALFEAAQSRLQSGFFGEAHELMIDALNMFNQVYGPLHPDIVVCYRAVARIHYLADDSAQAVAFQKKAVIVAERIYGIDHPETLVAYVHLALYCYHAGLVTASLKLMYRSRYLANLAYGEDHPDIATFDTNIGLMLHNQREFKTACEYLEHSCNLQMKFHGPESLSTATGHHLVARALTAQGEYKLALNSEKSTHTIYQKHFGAQDVRTKESGETLKTILSQAVMLEKTLKDIAEKGKIHPGKVPKLEDKIFDKKILTMVNKIE